jgi:hypothetical protein
LEVGEPVFERSSSVVVAVTIATAIVIEPSSFITAEEAVGPSLSDSAWQRPDSP